MKLKLCVAHFDSVREVPMGDTAQHISLSSICSAKISRASRIDQSLLLQVDQALTAFIAKVRSRQSDSSPGVEAKVSSPAGSATKLITREDQQVFVPGNRDDATSETSLATTTGMFCSCRLPHSRTTKELH